MQGTSDQLTSYLEGNKVRFLIPVYQRKYEWKQENCLQLYKDLCRLSKEQRSSHFFGSIVANVVPNNGIFEHHIIDGQQRITTVMLMFLAMYNLLSEGKLKSESDSLKEEIYETYLISKFKKGEERFRLVPVAADREAFQKLFGAKEDYDKSSNLTINYEFFYNLFLREEITIDDLNDAINKLEIINITLEHGDNAQLIFESLNSTGLALEEGDKIRNYVLMGQEPSAQEKLFNDYWKKIEDFTQDHVSDFIRDYLSIKQQSTPNINSVYPVFKRYVEDNELTVETVLEDLLKYARLFNKLLTCKSGLGEQKLDDCLYRLKKLEITVVRPFFLEVLKLNLDGKLSSEDVLRAFLITESYLFRRNICDVPTNALNKIFVTLNKEILRFDNSANDYVEKLVFALESKKESGRFPDDEEFATALDQKQVYLMRGRYKAYLFERFENYGTVEVKDVNTLLDNNTYTIEHIMPQHLTSQWQENLGENYEDIHSEWLHRLANLTLSGYNPNLSNKTFIEKRDASDGGYKNSGIRMNQRIAQLDQWGLKELVARSKEMVQKALEIWSYPVTAFVPVEKEFESCTLDDEDIDLTGREIFKYSFKNAEQPVNSWADMVEGIVNILHQQDKSVLTSIAFAPADTSELGNYISKNPEDLRSPLKVDENIYFEKNTSTAYKMIILRKLFLAYHADPMDLVFYLKDPEVNKVSEVGRKELRKRYWEFALPLIQNENSERGTFSNCVGGISNNISGYFGIGGFSVSCVANYDESRVDLWLSSGDKEKNKEAFDLLYAHKEEIENAVGMNLEWSRAADYKASWIIAYLNNVSLKNENDWQRMARFHSEISHKIIDSCLPLLAERYMGAKQSAKYERLSVIAQNVKNWAADSTEVSINPSQSARTYIRFRTPFFDTLLPDTPDRLSGWNTGNHYFYEVRNYHGDYIYTQLAFSSRNLSDEQREIMNKIQLIYPSKKDNPEWQWRIPFITQKYYLDDGATEQSVKEAMEKCLQDIMKFEKDLDSKLSGLSSQGQ